MENLNLELKNPIRLNIQRFYLTSPIPASIRMTSDYMMDSAHQITYRKYKVTGFMDFKQTQYYTGIQLNLLQPTISISDFTDGEYFITNIKATQMLEDEENSDSQHVNVFQDVSSKIKIWNNLSSSGVSTAGSGGCLCVKLDSDDLSSLDGALVYFEFDLWMEDSMHYDSNALYKQYYDKNDKEIYGTMFNKKSETEDSISNHRAPYRVTNNDLLQYYDLGYENPGIQDS